MTKTDKGGGIMLSEKVRIAKQKELLNYINDIRSTAADMKITICPLVKEMQLESIDFRVEKVKTLINELC
jgi:hypothetical protein